MTSHLLNFSNTQLLVKAKHTRGNGADITDADHMGGVNLFLHSLFQQVDISLNIVQVNQSSETYTYRVYFESFPDTDPKQNTLNSLPHCFTRTLPASWIVQTWLTPTTLKKNVGLQTKALFTDEGATVDTTGDIHSDVFLQDRVMLDEVQPLSCRDLEQSTIGL